MDASLNKDEKKALVGTVIFHLVLLILFLLTGMKYMEPPPPETGILINFGTSDDGMGDEQSQNTAQTNPEPQEQVTEETPQTASAQEEVATQETEEAPALNTKKSETIRKEEPKPEEPKPSEQLTKAMNKWNNKSDRPSTSDGKTGKPGDQGDESGSMDSKNYTGGTGGGGPEHTLNGRKLLNSPKIQDNSQEEGKVVVDIIVDKYGNVTRANPGARGSTTASSVLYGIAKEAALKTKFNANPNGPEDQKGQLIFTFLVKG